MKQKNISFRSNDLLTHFIGLGQSAFELKDVLKMWPEDAPDTLRKLLSDMVKRGLLMRIKGGLYYIIPYEQDAQTFIPDWHLLAEQLAGNKKHYIGYYSAMQIHQLITQPSLHEIIVTDQQFRPANITVKDIMFQFVYHNEKHFFGAEKIWIDSFNKVMCSDLEKTIVDCLFKPGYAGGIVEVAKAIFMAKDRIRWELLADYCDRFGSQAVVKRLGFVLDTYHIGDSVIKRLAEMATGSYVLLDPDAGKEIISSKNNWFIRENIDVETIKQVIYT